MLAGFQANWSVVNYEHLKFEFRASDFGFFLYELFQSLNSLIPQFPNSSIPQFPLFSHPLQLIPHNLQPETRNVFTIYHSRFTIHDSVLLPNNPFPVNRHERLALESSFSPWPSLHA